MFVVKKLLRLFQDQHQQRQCMAAITHPCFIASFLFVVLIGVMSHGEMGNDEGMWSYIGRVWNQHHIPPYSGSVENKTPSIFLLYALSHRLFGINIFFVRFLGVLATIFSALTVYSIAKSLHSHFAGAFSMLTFGIMMGCDLVDGAYTSATETFMVLFSSLAFLCLVQATNARNWKRWTLLAGISMGLALSFKQIALTSTIALCLYFMVVTGAGFSKTQEKIGLLYIAFGLGLATFASFMTVWVSGVSLGEYIRGAWMILLIPASSAPPQLRWSGFVYFLKCYHWSLFYPLIALLICQPRLLKQRYLWGVLIWFVFDFIGVNASGYYFGHQFKQMLPSACIMLGIGISTLITRFVQIPRTRQQVAVVVLVLLTIRYVPHVKIPHNFFASVTGSWVSPHQALGLWLKENTPPDDYVYVAGYGGNVILAYSDRVSASRYFNSIFITCDSASVYMEDLETTPPLYFVNTADDLLGIRELHEWINKNYALLYQGTHRVEEPAIYKRKS